MVELYALHMRSLLLYIYILILIDYLIWTQVFFFFLTLLIYTYLFIEQAMFKSRLKFDY